MPKKPQKPIRISMELADKMFPMKEYRDGQRKALEFAVNAINSGKKYIIIEAPTGAGKSPIAIAIARMITSLNSSKAYYITITKILQDQLDNDFGENGKYGNYTTTLKGRNAYNCGFMRNNADEMLAKKIITRSQHQKWKMQTFDCAEGRCKQKGKASMPSCLRDGTCPYHNQKQKAAAAAITTMNFSSFLYQVHLAHNDFGSRRLMIVDEVHNSESQLMGFVSLVISDRDIPIKIPKYNTVEQYIEWMDNKNIHKLINREIIKAEMAEDPRRVDTLKNISTRYKILTLAAKRGEEWIVEYSRIFNKYTRIEFKPIYVDKYAHKYLFDMADVVLMTSATILDVNVLARSLGIPKEEIAALRLGSRFPVENRPIYFRPVVKVVGGNAKKSIWGPPLVKSVNEIVRKHGGQKGIIHTHNYAISNMLYDECDKDVKSRLLYQKEYSSKVELLEDHRSRKDSVILAPAMHEGLDLYDDHSRFQIICKVPFPNFFEDKQLAARKERDGQFYTWLTALKLLQACGRSVRSKDDWAHTYIIDESFRWWYNANKRMLPKWFKESIVGI